LTQSRILVDIKSLASKSAIYGVGSISLKLIGFLLIPLYTRYLTPADYGIMAVTGTVISILSILYPLGLVGAATRFYFTAKDEDERRRNNGTIWIAMLLFALAATALLDRLGNIICPLLFRDIPFEPYVRMALWITFLNILSLVPLALFQVRERPVPYVILTVSNTLLTIGLVINFVVLQEQGVYGYLYGTLLSLALFATPYIVLTLRSTRITFHWNVLKAALAFGLPLVPHSLASWVLELSDRIILQRFVPLGELGLYSLGYQFGGIIRLFATAINFAWVPFLYKTDAQQGETAKPKLARLATYYVLCMCYVSLGLAMFVKEIIFFMTAPAFHPAYRVAPWIIGGWLFSGLYFIPVNFLFLKSKTGLVPLITIPAGLFNIGFNLWLVPRYGIMAAAWSTFLAYGLMLALAWGMALRVYPFPYEYKRLGITAAVTVGLFAASIVFQVDSIAIELGVKAMLLLAYPFVLILLRFFTTSEKKVMHSFLQQSLVVLHRTVRRAQS
jgi:O-antigen/teichoic acid export membrane protein